MRVRLVLILVAVFLCNFALHVHAEEITSNQTYCVSIAKARVDVVNLLCKGVSGPKLTEQIKVKYTSMQSDVFNDILESETNHFTSDRCMDAPESIFKNSFTACYSALSSLSGK